MQQYRTDQSPGLLLSGIMLVSIGLFWSGLESPTIIYLKSYTCPLTRFSKLYRIDFFGLEVVRLWPPIACPHASSAGVGTGLRTHWGGVNPWMDSAHKAIFSQMLSGRKHCLWCWWDPVARPLRRQDPWAFFSVMFCHNVFLCLQYSSVFLVYFYLIWIYCTVVYSTAMYSIDYLIFWLLWKRAFCGTE